MFDIVMRFDLLIYNIVLLATRAYIVMRVEFFFFLYWNIPRGSNLIDSLTCFYLNLYSH